MTGTRAGCPFRIIQGSHRVCLLCIPSAHDVVVPARGKAIAKTDLAVATPLDCYARIGESLLLVYGGTLMP